MIVVSPGWTKALCLAVTTLSLTACHYASSPVDGFGGFIGDTHGFSSNPNDPPGNALNMQRVQGGDVEARPLLPEAGNIWPGPAKLPPTLEDIEREQNQDFRGPAPGVPDTGNNGVPPASAAHPQPRSIERGSSTPPPPVQPASPGEPPPPPPPPPPPAAEPPLPPPTITTPQGPQVLQRGGNGVTTTLPPGASGNSIVVPNGNGTSTIIGPDGSVQTVPNPR